VKVTPSKPKNTITMKTTDKGKSPAQMSKWWEAKDKKELCSGVLSSAAFLKESQGFRFRQAALYARLYGNQSLFNFIGTNLSKLDSSLGLPTDRPTFNLVQSCVDTLVSKISQTRPSPVFLTDGSDYKERNLAKKLNNFILGEFYQCKAYEKGAIMLRDALVEGTGCLKVYETSDNKVGLDRVLLTELLIDPNEAIYGEPRQLYQLKLVDRDVLISNFPKMKAILELAENAYIDNSLDSSKTIADQVLVVEAWRLPTSKDSGDGRHVIACSAGTLVDDEYTKDKFPFVFMHFSPRLLGFWAQGLAEQLMGTQLEINSLLFQVSRAIKLVGVPRIFVEDGSKVIKSHFNNDIGSIITYRGIKPSYEVAQCVPQELYDQLQRLINYGYQQAGVSSLQASSEKPAGLNSGEAIRSYDDISTDRFAALNKRYDTMYIDLAYLIMDTAMDIAEREGKYQTVFPNKNGTKMVDLPKMSLLKNPFVIQCFNASSLPRDPAGRLQKITEMMQAGMITIKEGRRLLDYPDIEQVERLANASEERIYQILDDIIEDGKYQPADPFMDLQLANDVTVQYYNLYMQCSLEEEKAQMLRDFFVSVQGLKGQAQQAASPQPTPQANPEPLPQSPLVPNANQPGQQA
jgi:hypothetical protein